MAFDLASVLADVSNSGTNREQIEYISLDLIDGDEKNFYELSEIEGLANNIATIGLQQPLRVRPNPDAPDRYITVSGHRRRAALMLLAEEQPERWKEVACIVARDSVSPALQQLWLIFGNANTRKLSSADQNEQAAQAEKLLYQLKEEGFDFPGRMRDHVAQVVQISKTKLARLKMIRDNLAECWKPAYKQDILGESSAYELCRMSTENQILLFEEKQRTGANLKYLYADDIRSFAESATVIEALSCERSCGGSCINADRKLRKAAVSQRGEMDRCNKCCNDCYYLTSCKNACPRLKDKIDKIKAEAREEKRQEKLAQEEKDRPVIEKLQQLWLRFGYAREQTGKSVKEVFAAARVYYVKSDDEAVAGKESGYYQFSTYTPLPYGNNFRLSDAEPLIAIADLFGCSIDYLLCRTDIWEMAQPAAEQNENVSNSDTGWQTNYPRQSGKYVVIVRYADGCDATPEKMEWSGSCWMMFGQPFAFEDAEILGWMPMPQKSSPLNGSCKTGMSPSGHCGAAACCPEEVDCCLNCGKDCNMRCGWMEDIEYGLSVSDN